MILRLSHILTTSGLQAAPLSSSTAESAGRKSDGFKRRSGRRSNPQLLGCAKLASNAHLGPRDQTALLNRWDLSVHD